MDKEAFRLCRRLQSFFALITLIALGTAVFFTNTNEAQNDISKDLADQELAKYTFWLTVFTAILAISTIALWITTFRGMRDQSKDMKASIEIAKAVARFSATQNEISAATSVMSHRPWMRVEMRLANIRQINDIWHIDYAIFAENVGNSPCIYYELVFHEFPNAVGSDRNIKLFLDNKRKEQAIKGGSVFPSKKTSEPGGTIKIDFSSNKVHTFKVIAGVYYVFDPNLGFKETMESFICVARLIDTQIELSPVRDMFGIAT